MTSTRKAANDFRVDVPRLTMGGGEEQAGPHRLVLMDSVAGMTRRGMVERKSSRGGLAKRRFQQKEEAEKGGKKAEETATMTMTATTTTTTAQKGTRRKGGESERG